MAFYTGSLFPGMARQPLCWQPRRPGAWRLTVTGTSVTAKGALFGNLGERFRAIKPASDGSLVLVTDSGKLLRLTR